MKDENKSPEAIAIIARLKKGKGKPEMTDEESSDTESENTETEGNVDEEAKSAASEDVLQAVRDRDADALKEALTNFFDACGY